MTYEEKLQKIVSKLKDERDLTRKGHNTKVTFTDESFTKVRILDICKILLKLQDDEKCLVVKDAYALDPLELDPYDRPLNENYDNVTHVVVELDEAFDGWYESYLMTKKPVLKILIS